MYPQI